MSNAPSLLPRTLKNKSASLFEYTSSATTPERVSFNGLNAMLSSMLEFSSIK